MVTSKKCLRIIGTIPLFLVLIGCGLVRTADTSFDASDFYENARASPALEAEVELFYISPRPGIGMFGHTALRVGNEVYSYVPSRGELILDNRLFGDFLFDYTAMQKRSVHGVILPATELERQRIERVVRKDLGLLDGDSMGEFHIIENSCVSRLEELLNKIGEIKTDGSAVLPSTLFNGITESYPELEIREYRARADSAPAKQAYF